MSSRKKITDFLSRLLEKEKFTGMGKYWGKEVVVDYGTEDIRRIDYMEFVPVNQLSIDGIEKGEFKGYEVKSCKADFKSGFGQNYFCEYNYLVITMQTYKELLHEELNDLPHEVGVLVSIPKDATKPNKEAMLDEFDDPTPLPNDYNTDNWRLVSIRSAIQKYRKKPMLELMFCLLRNRC